ncbi:cell surface protein SprA, partial [Flavobacteriaceae bacterium]|nr:cell surface protein SprA [Flavobacteriaceae bacterium]
NIKSYFSEKIDLLKDEDPEDISKLKNLLPDLYINSNFFQTIFGGDNIELVPQGSISMDIGARYQKSDNPSIPSRNQSNIGLDFNQNISLSMNGKIGERLSISSNYDTQSTFDFQNLLKLDYTPTEDDIIQKIELGNVSMPLSGSLISGAQSLFGFKTELKFGNTNITAVLSEQRSQSQTVVSKGSGSTEEFSILPLEYDENRHFFLGQYFRDKYEQTVKTYPYLNTQIQISRIEVWVTNRSSQTQNVRNVIALQDLGESNPDKTKLDDLFTNFFLKPGISVYPDNSVNKLDPDEIDNGLLTSNIRDISKSRDGFGSISNLVSEGNDYSVLENARKLESNEYKLNNKLGYISLTQPLNNDEILAVAFQYSVGGQVYQVGEFANDGIDATSLSGQVGQQQISNNSLILKLLKSSVTNVNQPVWDLMMKNIYSIGSQVTKDDFKLNIYYSNPSPLNYIQAVDQSAWPDNINGKTLLSLFNFDNLNMNNDVENGGDGFFDFVPNITVDTNNGLVIFTSIEPFGKYLFDKLKSPQGSGENYENLASYNANQKKYVYNEIYSVSKTEAEKQSEKNKFQIKGSFKSSGDVGGISIGQFNIPRGSVKVTAGGRLLQEGLDYTVNYQAGRVQILDESLKNSSVPIEISTESNSFYSQQKKRFSGINIEHKFNENFIIGGTLMNLSERSISQKANYGVEPVNNTMIGFNGTFSSKVPFLTRLVNKLPNINTEVESNVSFTTEFAYLHSGTPKNSGFDNVATVYVDDFEGSETSINLKDTSSWNLSSTPLNVKGSDYGIDDLRSGYNRGKLAWYNIDPIFYTRQRPSEINENEISKNETRRIFIEEIFPQQDIIEGQSRIQSTFDLSYFPDEKGPYNNNINSNFENDLKDNWAGITRDLTSTNFEKSNVEFIQFWLLDTFSENESNSNDLGSLVLNLGNISEDILKDGKKQYENGLPVVNSQLIVNESNWGKTPATQSLVYSFDSDANNRALQDLGYDGLNDSDEKTKYTNGSSLDPAGDNYEYYIDASGGIVNRYKNYNGTQGNSPIEVGNTGRGSTTIPDHEDVNGDNTMNTIDSYFEYSVPITKNMNVGNHPFISDVRNDVKVDLPNGNTITTRWIQFKIPVSSQFYRSNKYSSFFKSINGIDNLRSIRFMRMYLQGFTSPITFRFGTLDLVRSEWKRYTKNLNSNNISYPNTSLEIGSVNILENENRVPVNYVLPPGVQREEINSNSTIIRQNEQSLSLKVYDLQPSDSKGVYKMIDYDMRQYKSLKMFIHAESLEGSNKLPGEGAEDELDKRLVGFLRLGSDLTENYYQIEIPLKPTSYNNGSSNRFSADQVWNPDSNSIDFSLEKLTKIKAIAMNQADFSKPIYFNENLDIINEFSSISELPGEKKYKFAIKGNPTIGSIKNIMIGVKNPSQNLGDILSAEVWFNELRLSDIDGKGGWSALASLDANLADFANISVSGKMSTIGFGSIDKSPNQRSREDLKQYGLMSSLNLGQVLPEKWKIQIPVSYSISEEFSTPEYDPFYQDIKLEDRLSLATRDSQRDSIKNQAISYRKISSINVLGLKKN